MCLDPCDDSVEYVNKLILRFKPKEEGNSTGEVFLRVVATRLLEMPNSTFLVYLNYNNRNRSILATVYVKDYSITSITSPIVIE